MIGGVRKTCEDLLRQLYIAKWTCNLEFVDNIEQFFRACGHIKVSPSRLETWRIIDLVLSAEGNDVLVDLPYCSDFRREALRVTNELLKLGKIEQAAIVVSLFVRQGAAGQLDFPGCCWKWVGFYLIMAWFCRRITC